MGADQLQNLNPGSDPGQVLPQLRDNLLGLETLPRHPLVLLVRVKTHTSSRTTSTGLLQQFVARFKDPTDRDRKSPRTSVLCMARPAAPV